MNSFNRLAFRGLFSASLLALTGCNAVGNAFNPFYDSPSPVALLGEMNDRALNSQSQKEDTARKALDAMGSYQEAAAPKPYHPVMQPAVIRLMWVPDHLNRHGNLVPAHYNYVKVLSERPGVTDAFDLEAQLGPANKGSGDVPFVYTDDMK